MKSCAKGLRLSAGQYAASRTRRLCAHVVSLPVILLLLLSSSEMTETFCVLFTVGSEPLRYCSARLPAGIWNWNISRFGRTRLVPHSLNRVIEKILTLDGVAATLPSLYNLIGELDLPRYGLSSVALYRTHFTLRAQSAAVSCAGMDHADNPTTT
ncbi:hypothetical protein BJV78DRAFT_606721 [Lactifluus subvellereus]|nr:hypothetical protein BJV78DRAFT_606721 [Lactifluus subvellereus]